MKRVESRRHLDWKRGGSVNISCSRRADSSAHPAGLHPYYLQQRSSVPVPQSQIRVSCVSLPHSSSSSPPESIAWSSSSSGESGVDQLDSRTHNAQILPSRLSPFTILCLDMSYVRRESFKLKISRKQEPNFELRQVRFLWPSTRPTPSAPRHLSGIRQLLG